MKTTFLQFVALASFPTMLTAQGTSCQIRPFLSSSQCLRAANIWNDAQVMVGDCTSNSHWATTPISFDYGTTQVALVQDNGEATNFCLDIGQPPSLNYDLKLFSCINQPNGRAVDQQRYIHTRDDHIGVDSTGLCLQYDAADNMITSATCTDNTDSQRWIVDGNC